MGSFMVGQNLNPDSLSSPVFLLLRRRTSFLPKCKAMRPLGLYSDGFWGHTLISSCDQQGSHTLAGILAVTG